MDSGALAAWASIGLALIMTIFGFVLRTYKEKIDEAKTEAVAARKELSEYKLVVAEKYASIAYLKDVESRILSAITDMTKRFDQFVADYHDTRQGR